MAICFGDCRFDIEARQLFRAGQEVHLSPKAFELLKLLVENRPRALSKSALLDHIWAGVFVSEASLARTINEVRDGVGESGSPRIIRTVHGYGYAFAAEANSDGSLRQAAAPGPRPVGWLRCGSRDFALWDGEQIVGRDLDLAICLDSPKVSRQHARIVARDSTLSIEDLHSKNGTFVRGVRIAEPTALEAGDQIQIGLFLLVVTLGCGAAPTETQVV
jgi:DNA-binding winged helix-turn-helix (wHTH) protein